jgi:hypothetical protein
MGLQMAEQDFFADLPLGDLLALAESGNAAAKTSLGDRYRYQRGVARDEKEAVRWYLDAADQGYAAAQINLGNLYRIGRGVAKDNELAVRWYAKAYAQGDVDAKRLLIAMAETGHAAAQCHLGQSYESGSGVDKDEEKAVIWYKKAVYQSHAPAKNFLISMAKRGHAGAQCCLGQLYENGSGVVKDHDKSVIWYIKAAEQGHDAAQQHLVVLAEHGHAVAQYNLGRMYESGRGVAKNDTEAVRWYIKAAEQGYDRAQFSLGRMYEDGRGVEENVKEAFRWYREVAEKGFPAGQYNLGRMYESGRGVAKNDAEAVRWYIKAAENGNADAQYSLGQMYESGRGVAENVEEAFLWYTKAAELGHNEAQHIQESIAFTGSVEDKYNLGEIYNFRLGIGGNSRKAVHWYILAAEQGSVDALSRMFTIGNKDAKRHLEVMAEAGNPDAQYYLAQFEPDYIEDEDYETRKFDHAIKWYSLAAEQGHVEAQYSLGLLFAEGVEDWRGSDCGDERMPDCDQSFYWYSRAAEQGHQVARNLILDAAKNGNVDAQFNFAKMYVRCGKNEDAVRWYTKAAELGFADAQYSLGCLYALGDGVKEDKEDALFWFTLAAEKGHHDALEKLVAMAEAGNVAALNNLGEMYETGSGVAEDVEEAVRCYTKIDVLGCSSALNQILKLARAGNAAAIHRVLEMALAGRAVAQHKLGEMYQFGNGLAENSKEAIHWYTKAAEQGYVSAETDRSSNPLEPHMRDIDWLDEEDEDLDHLVDDSLSEMECDDDDERNNEIRDEIYSYQDAWGNSEQEGWFYEDDD